MRSDSCLQYNNAFSDIRSDILFKKVMLNDELCSQYAITCAQTLSRIGGQNKQCVYFVIDLIARRLAVRWLLGNQDQSVTRESVHISKNAPTHPSQQFMGIIWQNLNGFIPIDFVE